MGKNSQLVAHVVFPDQVSVQFFLKRGFLTFRVNVLSLRLERAFVSILETFDIDADNLALVGHYVSSVTFYCGRRTDPDVFPIAHLPRAKLRNDELPVQFTGLFIKAHDNASIALFGWVPRGFVISSRIDASIRHGNVSISLRAELGDPLDVFSRLHVDDFILVHTPRIEVQVYPFFEGDHVAGAVTSPNGPIRSKRRFRNEKKSKKASGKSSD